MANVNNILHCVWATKRRFPFINPVNRPLILDRIRNHAREKGIYIDFINAHKDHVHCLLSISPTQNLSTVIKILKGESSRWICQNIPSCSSFEWAHEYYGVSVGPGILNRVRDYIRDQDIHHKDRSWIDEEKLIKGVIDRSVSETRTN